MKRLMGLFKNRWFTSILGLIALCILVWFVGPLIAFAGKVPLGTVVARLIMILVIVVIWGANNLRIQMQVNKANSDLSDSFSSVSAESDPDSLQSSEEVSVIKQRFDEALEVLGKTTRKKGGAGIYDLPWYIIIGPPGSGKTTALVNSGLKFPLAEQFGKEALRGVGGTRNCDWWFTDEAVLIDTAGRYTTQDSHASTDSAAWEGFLRLLKKHRQRRPINGAIVAISLSDLLTQGEGERAQQVRAIKQRLQELDTQLGVRFPVYVMLTKCDLVAGFTEFFEDLGLGDREQVWGTSFPLAAGSGELSPVEGFLGEFDALVDRLNKRLLMRMQQERDLARRSSIFSFPQQIASLRPVLDSFLTDIFSSTRYDRSLMLRGVYFTSGTQEGTPIDRVMGSLSRTFGLSSQSLGTHSGQGRSYFVTRLFKNVIFEESELVGANRTLEKQRLWFQRFAYGGAICLTVIAVLGWMTSFTRNEVYIYRFKSALEDFHQVKSAQNNDINSFDQLLERLNGIRAVSDVYSPFAERVPFLMKMGLYQGDRLTKASNELYREELDALLLPSVKYRLEQHLESGLGGHDLQYEALKTYLMLADEDRLDPDLVKLWMAYDWQNMYPSRPEVQGQFQNHLSSMLDLGFQTPELNADIIENARLGLRSVPLSELLFGRMKRDYVAIDKQPFRVIDAAGPGGRLVFQRASGVDLDQGFPSLFTYEGYHDYFKDAVTDLAENSAEENWILDPEKTELTKPEIEQLNNEMQELYFADYIRSWDQLLADIDIVSFSSLRQAGDSLNTMGASNSPVRSLLKTAAYHTSLNKLGQIADGVGDALNQTGGNRLSRLFGSAAVSSAPDVLSTRAQVVDEHFADLKELMSETDAGTAPPIEGLLPLFSQLFAQFDAMAMGIGADPLSIAKGASGGDLLARIQAESSRQPEPMRRWLQQVAQSSRQVTVAGARSQINAKWQSDVLPLCQRATEGRYPFEKSSTREITLVDFGRLFGPGGMFDNFFAENLESFVSISGGRWNWKPVGNVTLGISEEVLDQFERAAQIRELYFQTGTQMPSVSFGLKPIYLDANVRSFSLDLEGQDFRYRHGPTRIMRATWPNIDGTGQVRMEFEDDSGALLASTIEGPWAWFRLLDRSELTAETSDLVLASFTERGRTSTWELRADTVTNPFLTSRIKQFRCPETL